MELLIFYMALAITVSFICSVLEAVVLSLSPNYLESLKGTDIGLYNKLAPLRKNVEKPLASILTINTFAHTIGAAGAGAQALHVFGDKWIATFSVVLTLAILFLSEIIPKSIGAQYWKSLLKFSATVLPPMITLTLPLVIISEFLSRAFSKEDDKTSRDEIKAIMDIGLKDGAIEESEHKILKKSLAFKLKHASEVLTLKQDVIGVTYEMSSHEVLDIIYETYYSRLPIFGVNKDDLKGYVLRADILKEYSKKQGFDLKVLSKPMLIVPSDIELENLLKRLLERKEHICAIVNEFGDFQGVITLENLLEELLGLDILDEFDKG